MVLDGSDATVGSTALSAAHLIVQAYATKVMTEQTALSGRAASLDSSGGGQHTGLVQPRPHFSLLHDPGRGRNDTLHDHGNAYGYGRCA